MKNLSVRASHGPVASRSKVSGALKLRVMQPLLLCLLVLAGLFASSGLQSASASPYTEGTKKVIVLRTLFSNQNIPDTSGYRGSGQVASETELRQLVGDTSFFFQDQSFNKTRLDINVFTVQFLGEPGKDIAYQPKTWLDIRNDARARATASGLDLSQYDLDIIAFSINPYTSSGAATSYVGYSGIAFVGAPGQAVNGWNGGFNASVISHETGHNYGALHANTWLAFFEGTTIGQGQSLEYGNPFDVMGSQATSDIPDAHFTAAVKNRMGWLPNGQGIKTLEQKKGTYLVEIEAIDDILNGNPTKPLAIKIKRTKRYSNNSGDNFWVEFRDAWFQGQRYVNNGAVVTWNYEQYTSNASTDLIDSTPETKIIQNGIINPIIEAEYDAPLAVGRTISDLDAYPDIHITPLSRSARVAGQSTMQIQVVIGSYGENTPPEVDITVPATADVAVANGVAVPLTAVGTDPDTGEVLHYYWDFGDGTRSNDDLATQSHTFQGTNREFTVSVRVSDGKGGEDTDTVIVKVGNVNTHRIAGKVSGLNVFTGQPIKVPNALVRISRYDEYANGLYGDYDFSSLRYSYTDDDGNYTITGIKEGENYQLEAGKEAYIFNHTGNWDNPITVLPARPDPDWEDDPNNPNDVAPTLPKTFTDDVNGDSYVMDNNDAIKLHNFTAITTDLIDPVLTIEKPADGSTISAVTEISGTTHDNPGGSGVQTLFVSLQRISDGKFWNPTGGGAGGGVGPGAWETVVDPNPGANDGTSARVRIERAAPKMTATVDPAEVYPSKGVDVDWEVPTASLPPAAKVASDEYTITATAADVSGNRATTAVAVSIRNTVVPSDVDPDTGTPGTGTSRIDLNGSGAGVNRTDGVWNQSGSSQVAATTATVTKTSGTISKIEVTLVNPQDANETLAATGSGAVTVQGFNSSTGVLTLLGPASPADFQTTVRSVTYSNPSSSPTGTSRSIRFRVFGGTEDVFATSTLTAGTVVTPPGDDDDDDDDDDDTGDDDDDDDDTGSTVKDRDGDGIPDSEDPDDDNDGIPDVDDTNDKVFLDLNGYNGSGNNFLTKWTKAGLTELTDADGFISAQNGTVESLTVRISNLQDGTFEKLDAGYANANVVESYNSATGILTLIGTDTVLEYQKLLRSIVYKNSAEEPTGNTRTFTFTADGGAGQNATATTKIDADNAGNSNNTSFFVTGQPGNGSVTIKYIVRNTTGLPISGIVVTGNLLGEMTDNEGMQISLSQADDTYTSKWLNPFKADRALNPSKARRGIVWRVAELVAGEEATLTITLPLREGADGGNFTDTWKADFPGAFADEFVDPVVSQ